MTERTSKVETWNSVAETYLDEITDAERKLADEIYFFIQTNLPPETKSIIELGSGSGHLSAVLAEKGLKTSLLDFSPKALDKASKIFEKYNLEIDHFYEQDLFDINIDQAVDLAWNSGVMEHFNDYELDLLINQFKKINAKSYLIIVPNVNSLPYILHRNNLMRRNLWTYGMEFLRNDYIQHFEKAGFKLISTEYFGTKFTEYNLNETLKVPLRYEFYKDQGMISSKENYLIGYHFSLDQGEMQCNTSTVVTSEKDLSESIYKTTIFDLNSKVEYISDVLYATSLERDKYKKLSEEALEKNKQLQTKEEDVLNENKALKEEVEAINIKNSELSILNDLLNNKNSDLSVSNDLLQSKYNELNQINTTLLKNEELLKKEFLQLQQEKELLENSWCIRILKKFR